MKMMNSSKDAYSDEHNLALTLSANAVVTGYALDIDGRISLDNITGL